LVLRRPFFRDDRDTRRNAFKILQNDSFRGLIRRSHRRAIGFVAQRICPALSNSRRRTGSSRRQLLHKGFACVGVESHCGFLSFVVGISLGF
jgi:hypothetical protein